MKKADIIDCVVCGHVYSRDAYPSCPRCLNKEAELAYAAVATPEAYVPPSTISRDEKAALRAVQQLYRTLPKGAHNGQMGCIKITRSWEQVLDGETGKPLGHKKPITMANCTIRLYHSTSVDMDVE